MGVFSLREEDYLVRKMFGQTIRRHRKERNMTLESLAYVVGTKEPSMSQWETGKHFPNSLRVFQRMNVVFDGELCGELKKILTSDVVCLDKSEQARILVNMKLGRKTEVNSCWGNKSKYGSDERALDILHKKFGRWLRQQRTDRMRMSMTSVIRMFGASSMSVYSWETGIAFPRCVHVYQTYDFMLDGEFTDTMFGMAKDNDVKLPESEVKKVLRRLKEVQ